MFKYRIRMFLNELKVLVLTRSESSPSGNGGSSERSAAAMRGLGVGVGMGMGMGMGMGGCGWPPFVDCRSRNDDEDYYGSGESRPRGLRASDDKEPKLQAGLDAVSLASTASGLRSPQCRICFQGPEQVPYRTACLRAVRPPSRRRADVTRGDDNTTAAAAAAVRLALLFSCELTSYGSALGKKTKPKKTVQQHVTVGDVSHSTARRVTFSREKFTFKRGR